MTSLGRSSPGAAVQTAKSTPQAASAARRSRPARRAVSPKRLADKHAQPANGWRAALLRVRTAAVHALSTIFSAALVSLFATVAIAASLAPEIAPEAPIAAPMLILAAPILDLDGDGLGDAANPTNGFIRGEDAYGSGAFGAPRDGGRRRHAGADYVAAPGAPVHAPIAGKVTQIGEAYEGGSGLTFIEIRQAGAGERARVFYVAPSVRVGDIVTAGDALGTAQDLRGRYPDGITNHVHVEIKSALGRTVDPTGVLPAAHYQIVPAAAS